MAAQNSSSSTLKKDPSIDSGRGEGVRTLLSWKAPERLFKKRSKDYYTTVAAIVFLTIVILLFFKQWVLILTVLSLMFLVYTLGTIPPKEVEHKITTQGIITGEHSYLWRDLSDFWFTQSHDQSLLNIETFLRLPGRIFLLLGDLKEEQVREVLVKYLPYREVIEKTWMDKAAEWLVKKFPLEKS